jgi:tetratricopeptide (TPR) repeat protein
MSSNDLIERLVVDASNDPLNPKKNFDIAIEYERLGQTASAVGFYLRAAEYGYKTDPLITYTSLLKISVCIEGQKDRKNTVSNVILQAMAYLPERPEAYFLLSKFYEKDAGWQETYTYASLGANALKTSHIDLPVVVGDYHGAYAFKFQIAVSAWWIGRREESLRLLNELDARTDLSDIYKNAVKANLEKLGA